MLVAGEFLSPDLNTYDMVLVKDYADRNDIKVGHDLRVLTSEGLQVVRIVGLMSKEGPGILNNGAFGVVPLEAAREMFGRVARQECAASRHARSRAAAGRPGRRGSPAVQ